MTSSTTNIGGNHLRKVMRVSVVVVVVLATPLLMNKCLEQIGTCLDLSHISRNHLSEVAIMDVVVVVVGL
jgi:hypothetical protein